MNEDLKLKAIQLTNYIMETFYRNRDIDEVLNHLNKDVSWIGPGEREQKYTFAEIKEYFELAKDSIPSCELSNADFRAISMGDDYCTVTGSVLIHTTSQSHMVVEVKQRLSFVYHLTEGMLKVIHMHLSNPYMEMGHEEYFPREVGTQNYEYLQRLLREKTEVIDMITSNIDGGLKGSNDDSQFSYFYVNEGLPRMLGYTYEEFMEKTGGTAVGAVYPPDLQNALGDCERCFSQGPVYSTEYRMEKKDGSLIWVLDTGRKAADGDGMIKINSIITDITQLKMALFDLEVERERYRMAQQNITDVMCEYDISQDLYTTYQRVEIDGKTELEKFVIQNFTKAIGEKNLVHPEDIEQLMDLYCGRNHGPVEVRTNFFHLDTVWHWSQCRCSIILNSNGEPIRAIGMMKDITEEKEKNMELLMLSQIDGLTQLLNQTTAKKYIQNYLSMGRDNLIGALLIIDLDKFKNVNDTKGHLYGNDVLMETANILRGCAMEKDIVGRIGGDEFIMLIKDATEEVVAERADQMIRGIYEISKDDRLKITCSIGIVLLQKKLQTYDELFLQADTALYQAKNKGRNQWAVYSKNE